MPIIAGYGLNFASLPHGGDMDAVARLCERIAEAGSTHVEVSCHRVDLVTGGRANPHRIRAVRAAVEGAGLVPVLHAPHAIILMDRPRLGLHRAVARASVEVCEALGAPSMVVHSGVVPLADWVADRGGLLSLEREELAALGDVAAAAGVRIAVENLIASPRGAAMAVTGADPSALAAQLARLGHDQVGGCFDFGHAWLSSSTLGFDFLAAAEAFSPHVWHLHLHDNCGHPDGAAGFADPGFAAAYGIGDMHAPMFWGTIPWAELIPRLALREGGEF